MECDLLSADAIRQSCQVDVDFAASRRTSTELQTALAKAVVLAAARGGGDVERNGRRARVSRTRLYLPGRGARERGERGREGSGRR